MVKPLKEIISEEEFLTIFQKQTSEILKICGYLASKEDKDFLFTKRFYGNITTQARILEDFLDDYGAKNNRTWIYFRELTASARYMGFSAYMIQHLRNRYALYDLKSSEEMKFLEHTIEAQDFVNSAIKNVFSRFVLKRSYHKITITRISCYFNPKYYLACAPNMKY